MAKGLRTSLGPSSERLATGLVWRLKPSFLSYLTRTPGAQTLVNGGAGTTSTGDFYFQLTDSSDFNRSTGLGTLKFRGQVRFTAHHGMLFVLIADPWVVFGAETTIMSVVDVEGYPDTHRMIPLVTLSKVDAVVIGDTVSWTATPTHLASGAAHVFNDVYPVGEPFGSMDIRMNLALPAK
ncbi:HtaA domain-containing protein [Rhodococcus sp. UFZ-B548]|uniref:HtaA domain-containing protein n=1 Tax=Rhodococcus sp. UFZ-B548 TaxID=2742212 RepID=UPI0015F623CC|nr:HtaA domain-containing protein [Rhodococcus sp. UFZ-B548]